MLKTDNSGPEGHTNWSKVYLNAKKYMAADENAENIWVNLVLEEVIAES